VPIAGFDHVAIPISAVPEMLVFYRRLGFDVDDRTPPFYAVHFGDQKINMHGPEAWQAEWFKLRGPTAAPGCGDFCFVWSGSEEQLLATLNQAAVAIIEGPVARKGGRRNAAGQSLYVRDPDQNLLEFIIYE
jgi:catechol 2,3-dioxygenase-like lactoylglutathione lyase family enzyme